MRQHVWTLLGLVFLAILCNFGECRSLVKRQIHLDASIDPQLQEVEYEDDEDRDKRAVDHKQDPKFAIKNALLGFVFNPSISKGISLWERRPLTTTTKRPTTTEDIVIFEKNKPVSLEVDSRLFGSGFSLITKVSTSVGDYMINSALRLQRFLEIFRPAIRSMFGAKGFVIEATTNKAIFSDNSATR